MTYPEEPGFVAGSDTSEQAADSIRPTRAGMKMTVWRAVYDAPDGLTCDECEVITELVHQTCSARIRELVLDGFVYDSGRRRPTRSGRSARIYLSRVRPLPSLLQKRPT